MTVREDLAAAASTVDGITVLPFYVQAPPVGSGFVHYLRTNYPNKFGGIDTWQIVVAVPPNLAEGQNWIEANRQELVDALKDELIVRTATPTELILDGGSSLRALVIEGDRESE